MIVPRFHLSFDVGLGGGQLTETPMILLTHGHLDHSSGIAYYISQRCLRRLPPGIVYCPPEIVDDLNVILKAWSRIEHYEIQYEIRGVDYSVDYPLQGNFYFQAVRSVHRVPSNGYVITEKTQKLKPEYLGIPGEEIRKLKESGADIFYEASNPMIAFSGDTQIEWVQQNEIVQRSKVVFMECTYIDDKRPTERAREWGHTHLDEIVENAEYFRGVEKLFLIHFSPRYSREKIQQALKNKLPSWLWAKTTPFLTIHDRNHSA